MAELLQARLVSAPLLILAVAIAAGILVGHHLAHSTLIVVLGISVGVTIAIAFYSSKKRFAVMSIAVCAAFFTTGVVLSRIDSRPMAPNRIARLCNEGTVAPADPVELTGVVNGEPETTPDGFYLALNVESLRTNEAERPAAGRVLLLARTVEPETKREYERLELRHGARIRVMTLLDREEDFRNPGVLPFTEYLERKGYDATGVIKSPLLVECLEDAQVFLPLAWIYQWRARLEREFAARFSMETGGVLDAALLGNRYNVSHAAAERFRAGGTFHVLVIAGLHISFIGGVVFLIVRRFTKHRLLQFIVAATFLWAYTIAVGAHAPVVRASLMFTLVVLAPIVSRRSNSLNVIGGAALGLLLWRPGDLFDPSFQLTILSVLAIVSLAVPTLKRMQEVGGWRPTHETPFPPVCARWFRTLSEAIFWSDREWRAEMANSNISYKLFKTPIAVKLERWRIQRSLRFAVAAIVVSASVQIGMLPLLVVYFHRLSMASILLNIFVGGLMAILGFVALAGVLVSQLSVLLAAPLILIAEKVNWLMIHLVDPFARFGLASIRLPHYSGWPAVNYALYYLPLGFLVFGLARWKPLRSSSIASAADSKQFSRKSLRIAAASFSVLLLVIILHPFSGPRPDGKLHVDFLDVGQGDAALLTMPDGTTLMIDGGGRPNFTPIDAEEADADEPFARDARSIGERVVSEFLWARGLDHVDYILPTHADADHIDGLNDVARNFRVRGAIVARTPPEDPEYARFAATMKQAGVPIEKIGAGDILRFGDVTGEVLWPPPTNDSFAPSRNNDGIVLRFRSGQRSVLFTADIEKQTEIALLKRVADLRSDIVKVPHHGSRTSSIEPFVAATQPSMAIISVGRTSPFGHPHQEVVARWHATGAEVMTTGQWGTITVTTDGSALVVSTFVQKKD